MTYIKKITFNSNFRNFKEGDSYDIESGITLLVGDQGSGKSTLLHQMFTPKSYVDLELTYPDQGIKTYYFDSEYHNPRIRGSFKQNATHEEFMHDMATKFSSHGQTLVHYTIGALSRCENCVVFIDEPESGLSVKNQIEFGKELKRASSRNCQMFVATHSIPIILSQIRVLSLEHKQWMPSQQFLRKHGFYPKDKD